MEKSLVLPLYPVLPPALTPPGASCPLLCEGPGCCVGRKYQKQETIFQLEGEWIPGCVIRTRRE